MEEVNPTANWVVHTETSGWPLVSLGTSSDRIFTPEGNQAYFVTIAKGIPGSSLAPYVSINYSEYESGFNFPCGLNWGITEQYDLLGMSDGRKLHLLFTVKGVSNNVTLMAIDLAHPRFGISLGWGF